MGETGDRVIEKRSREKSVKPIGCIFFLKKERFNLTTQIQAGEQDQINSFLDYEVKLLCSVLLKELAIPIKH